MNRDPLTLIQAFVLTLFGLALLVAGIAARSAALVLSGLALTMLAFTECIHIALEKPEVRDAFRRENPLDGSE